jgi:alpha-N-acetylglucosaminidase
MTRCKRFAVASTLIALAIAVQVPSVAARDIPAEPQAGAARAARRLAVRLLGDRANRFQFEAIPAARGRDVFEIETRAGRTVIRGNNGVAMAMGLNWYLKHHCRCHVS